MTLTNNTRTSDPVVTYADCRQDFLRLREEVEEALLDRLEHVENLSDETFEAVSALKVFWRTLKVFLENIDTLGFDRIRDEQKLFLIVTAVQLVIEKASLSACTLM